VLTKVASSYTRDFRLGCCGTCLGEARIALANLTKPACAHPGRELPSGGLIPAAGRKRTLRSGDREARGSRNGEPRESAVNSLFDPDIPGPTGAPPGARVTRFTSLELDHWHEIGRPHLQSLHATWSQRSVDPLRLANER
jgi:hypothetical protein